MPDCRAADRPTQSFSFEGEYPPIVRADIFIAFARPLPDLLKIHNANAASVIGDHSGLLQFALNFGHACAPDAHHLRQKFLG